MHLPAGWWVHHLPSLLLHQNPRAIFLDELDSIGWRRFHLGLGLLFVHLVCIYMLHFAAGSPISSHERGSRADV
jgi:hypothetical protein